MDNKKLVVITGASSGIGEQTARAFSAAGYPLLLLARRIEKMEALGLPRAMCCKVDITDRSAFEAAIKKAEAEYGEIGTLINNAGVMLLGQIATQDPAEWKSMFDVDVLALLGGMQIALQKMMKSGSGTIINISSVAGRKSFANHAAYCGAKFAVSAISETVREEVAGSGIRVSSICPGAVETELLSHTTSKEIKNGYEQWKEEIGGAISSDDIARAALFIQEQPQNVCIREIVLAATRQAN